MYKIIEEGGFFIGKYCIYQLSSKLQLKIWTFDKDEVDNSQREWWGFILKDSVFMSDGVNRLKASGRFGKGVRFEFSKVMSKEGMNLIIIKEERFSEAMIEIVRCLS